MAVKTPIVDYNGKLKELEPGDTISGSSSGGSLNNLTNTITINFDIENDIVITTISNVVITNSNIKNAFFIPVETSETSLDDFSLNGLAFNIENIIDNTSFDIRTTALNNATGNYTVTYKIIY